MDGISKKIREKNMNSVYRFDLADYDASARFLIGWPGYRTSRNKSGLGYVETQAEMAHMQGLFFRWLMTGKFKTRNPIYLFCIAVFGIINACPLLLFFAGEAGQKSWSYNWFIFAPYSLIGILLLVNVILSLTNYHKGESITGD